jgi:hypothetical protein
MSADEDSLDHRVTEELGHRRRYGQSCQRIRLGDEAFIEACSMAHVLPIMRDGFWVSSLYRGLPLIVDSTLPPTCFEIE